MKVENRAFRRFSYIFRFVANFLTALGFEGREVRENARPGVEAPSRITLKAVVRYGPRTGLRCTPTRSALYEPDPHRKIGVRRQYVSVKRDPVP